MNTGRCNCDCKCNGERIMVSRGCGCDNMRRNATCANTFHPTNNCGCRKEEDRCCPRPCPKPCESCEDRCRRQYRECRKECRCREEEKCGCQRPNPCGCHRRFDHDRYEED